MRRWILVLLLAVLPLQFAQAAAAAYCAHEKTVTKQHVGHHEHQHRNVAGDAAAAAQDAGVSTASADTPEQPSGSADTDCEYCHLSSAQPLGFISPSWIGALAQPAADTPPAVFASQEGADVERPRWSSAARSAGGRASPRP